MKSTSFAVAAAAVAASLSAIPVSGHSGEGVGFHISHQERRENEPYYQLLKARFGDAPARVVDNHLERRQATSSSSVASAASTTALASSSSSVATASGGVVSAATSISMVTMGTIPIGTTTTLEVTSPLPTTYAAGATVAVQGAPVLPSVTINPADWPALDKVPPLNSSQVAEWYAAIDWSQVPDIPVNNLGGCQNASNSQAITDAATNGWWTCGGHTRSSDVVTCPTKNTWGLSYDDGPSPDTPRLLQYLVENDLKSTFFVVGSRAISRPQMLQYEYAAGNQVSVHTWSHPYLTTKTNEEIVAELGWTKEAMRQIIGVTPNTMRPPYGDIDDRVRAICLQMGLRPIIWTVVNGISYDSFDWEVAGGVVNADTVVNKFEAIINNASSLDTGFIVLQHELYQQSTSIAIDYVLPFALSKPSLTLQPIFQCLGQSLADVYIETAPNNTKSGNVISSTLDRGSSATAGLAAANASGKSSSGSTGAASHSSTAPILSAICAVVVAGVAFAL